MGRAAREERIEELRADLARRFRASVAPGPDGWRRGTPLPSGWAAVDRALPEGGLAPGETVVLRAPPGGGALALASSWARRASSHGEPVIVLDAGATSAPHAWVEPEDARAPIWVVRPATAPEVWPALDIALRSGAFGLLLLLDPGAAPTGVGARLSRLTRDRDARLIVTGDAPFHAQARVTLRMTTVVWDTSPIGSAPAERAIGVRTSFGPGPQTPAEHGETRHDDTRTDRLRPTARAGDRRPSSTGRGRAARDAGRSGRR